MTVAGQQIDDALAQTCFIFDHQDAHDFDRNARPCKADVKGLFTQT